MKPLDSFIQWCRIRAAQPFIAEGAHVLDIGCHQGELFDAIPTITSGVGLDPLYDREAQATAFQFAKGFFPHDMPDERECFDTIVALAVFEHVPPSDKASFAEACIRSLKPGGRIIITVPSQRVDTILAALHFMRLIDGMSLEEHHGFDPMTTPDFFVEGAVTLHHASTFEFGLNHLFVFEKIQDGNG
jgi:SAM-dependent methyltransferase